MNIAFPPSPPHRLHRQRGVTLIIVLIIMLLGLLLALGSAKLTLLNERLSGNSTDYQRAYEAAEAMLADARLDLACLNGTCTNWRTGAGVIRPTCDVQVFETLERKLRANLNPVQPQPPALPIAATPRCQSGICVDLGSLVSGDPATNFWNNSAELTNHIATAATYRQFTTANGDSPDNSGNMNLRLVANAWYWIEILPYGGGDGARNLAGEQGMVGGNPFAPDMNCPFIFRITAVARGIRPGTIAALQTFHFFRSRSD